MRFSLDGALLNRVPETAVTLVVAEAIEDVGGSDAIRRMLDDAVAEVRARFDRGGIEHSTEVKAWHGALRALGVDPKSHPPSIETLVRRALADDAPRLGPLVDIANAVSLRYLLPVGAHDVDRLRGDFGVRLASGDEYFTGLGESGVVRVPAGEPVYADQREVRTRWWVGRQGDRGKVTAASKTVIFPIDSVDADGHARAERAANALAEALRTTRATRTRIVRVDRATPSVECGVEPRELDAIDRILASGFVELYPSRAATDRRLREGKPMRIYLGVDPTSPVIHIGHAVGIRKLAQLQKLGHTIVLLIGDFTGRIGDPTGKDVGRIPLTHEKVLENARSYREQASKILAFDGPNPVELRFNGEWWDTMTARQMIELAANFTVQQMIQRDMFQRRIADQKPIGLHEFMYPLLQGYDTIALDVEGEMGGTDQTFNMLAGRTLARALLDREKFVFVTGLLPGTDGRKMSKSFGNVIGVSDRPYEMYGRVMSLSDDLTLTFFEMCTDLDDDALDELRHMIANGINPMAIKKRLAHTITAMYHGEKSARDAADRFEREVQRGEAPEEMPAAHVERGGEWPAVDLLVATGLATSKGEARRLIDGGAVRIDDSPIRDRAASVAVTNGTTIRAGKRAYARVTIGTP
ncbi:MAG: tyrosine--tRNA ligase [Chloroflexota bacterium]|nr:MAG: tyrosine--tRNA ligase [Chloroflexota bacterium]